MIRQRQKQKQTVIVNIGKDVVRKKKRRIRRKPKTERPSEAPPRIITQYIAQFPPSTPQPMISQVAQGAPLRLSQQQEQSDVINLQERKEDILRRLEEAMGVQRRRTPPPEIPDFPSVYGTPRELEAGEGTPPDESIPIEETPLRQRIPNTSTKLPTPPKEESEFTPIKFEDLQTPKPRPPIPYMDMGTQSEASSSDRDEKIAQIMRMPVKQLQTAVRKLGINPFSPAYINKENLQRILLDNL